MEQDIEKEVIGMLSKMTDFDPQEITPNMRIVEDLNVDSLKVIEIGTAIEQKYKINITESQLIKIKTVKDCIKLIKTLLNRK